MGENQLRVKPLKENMQVNIALKKKLHLKKKSCRLWESLKVQKSIENKGYYSTQTSVNNLVCLQIKKKSRTVCKFMSNF